MLLFLLGYKNINYLNVLQQGTCLEVHRSPKSSIKNELIWSHENITIYNFILTIKLSKRFISHIVLCSSATITRTSSLFSPLIIWYLPCHRVLRLFFFFWFYNNQSCSVYQMDETLICYNIKVNTLLSV